MAKIFVYGFEENKSTPETIMLLGNKGAQLAEMSHAGVPVPPGFTITTVACNEYYSTGKKWPKDLETQIKANLTKLEKKMGKKLGADKSPLFVSVRSGSYVSMPGMMDTILNLGMNDKSVVAFANETKNERVAWDSYRRFIQMFGDVVMNVEHAEFEKIISAKKKEKSIKYDTDLSVADLKDIVSKYKKLIVSAKKEEFPQDPWEQLRLAINAVFESWNCERAVKYRKINKLRSDAGTGVNVQAMVFGNMGNDSATGVGFTRNPAIGENVPYGEYLTNAQGEDVVAGIRTPKQISELKKEMPQVYDQLMKITKSLEKHYGEMQDYEFTVEKGKLYILQTRNGKRTGTAAVKIVVDMVNEGVINKKEAVMRIKPEQLDSLLHKRIDEKAKNENNLIAKGLPASPGAGVGHVVFTAEEAAEKSSKDYPVILVRHETSPEDIEGMDAAQGVLTSTGGMTSHAAVVMRGMGKCCVAGAGDVVIDDKARKFTIATSKGEVTVKAGDMITIDGSTGEVFLGELRTVDPAISGDFGTLMGWADSFRKIGVRTNADTPKDAQVARDFGAEGIGLCRTEHMFFEGERIKAIREMILADTLEARKKALAKLLPFQKKDFEGIFEVMSGKPVIIRLLDPPLHEFLPKTEKDAKELSKDMKVSVDKIEQLKESMHEFNPMLGFRGCRLGVVYPEINEMQIRAIFEAALSVNAKGKKAIPEIEVPLVGNVNEFLLIKKIVDRVADDMKINKDGKNKVEYRVGTMIEVPRAVAVANELAKVSEFMSFGTNDLTQMTLGFSRDDAGKFIPKYIESGVFKTDPFQTIDQEGVGKFMKMCVEKARSVNKKIDIGICGEHGGDSESVKFCHRIGMNNVSCSPYRVPIARLAAAQAAIEDEDKKVRMEGA